MRVIDRLIKYLGHKKITAYSFERVCQVANGYLKKQQRGKGSVGSDILEKVHKNYFDLDMLWLITGEGDMLETGEEAVSKMTLGEERKYYTKDEMIIYLQERVALLESSIADKEKIIAMLEAQAGLKKKKTGYTGK